MKSDNKNYAKHQRDFANEPILQITLRELQAMIYNPRFWIGFIAVVFLLTIAGPFGTHQIMNTSPRLVYWAVISLVTFFTGSAISIATGVLFENQNFPDWVSWLVGGMAAGVPIGILVWFINIWVFEIPIERDYSFLQFIGYSTGIAIIVVTLTFLISNKHAQAAPSSVHSPFFKRLPVHLGKTLISLEAQDHYIKVTTTKGSELILQRLGDAQKELENYPGLRVHRSWWVASGQIETVERQNGKMLLAMKNDSIIPVSRNYMKMVKALALGS